MGWVNKDVSRTQYVYVAEGLILLVTGYLGAKVAGTAGLLAASVLCNLAVSGASGLRVSRDKIGVSMRSLISAIWLRPLGFAALFSPFALWIGVSMHGASIGMKLILLPVILVPVGIALAWFVGLNSGMRAMLAAVVKNNFGRGRLS
jgi:hypothetical protein